jgi:hypothetical protein
MERKKEMNFKEWFLDVSFDVPCFVPYDRETDTLITGINTISDKCPGKLVGVMHINGTEAVEEWIKNNPDFKERYT